MGKINYKKIYDHNQTEWKALTRDPQRYEELLAGHYSDSNHFIYELLQNAEDEKATKVVFEYYDDKLIFYHDGKPFNEKDVIGVSSMLSGKKNRDSAQTIGRFGMGFKSVFKYTHKPEIYSDNEAFYIENYLLPIELNNGWSHLEEKENLTYSLNSKRTIKPFAKSKHLTKIIIPFEKKDNSGNVKHIKGDEVLKKIKGLDGKILLFLSTIVNLFWIDIKTNEYALLSLNDLEEDNNVKICRIEGSDYEKEEVTNYLKFTKVFDHQDMKYANVSIAYKLNSRLDNINPIDDTNICVYFPTKDETRFPFLAHGSFETAVSREKLMEPSKFNDDLFIELVSLICDSLRELRDRKLITQMFIRKVLFVALGEDRVPSLRKKVTDAFLSNNLLPDKEGNYRRPDELSLPVPFEIANYKNYELFSQSFQGVKSFVNINNEKETNFLEYYTWLKYDLNIDIFTLETWASQLNKYNPRKINFEDNSYEEIKDFYGFLDSFRENLYINARTKYGSYYTRSGSYELDIRICLREAWCVLRQAPIILNEENMLTSAYKDNVAELYLNSSSKYKNVIPTSIVSSKIVKSYKKLLEDGFEIEEFNNFQFVKEKVIKKYINTYKHINFDNSDDYEDEYIEDIKHVMSLFDENYNPKEIQDMLRQAYIIRAIDQDGERYFYRPQDSYTLISEEGINTEIFNKEVNNSYYLIDYELFDKHEIDINKLKQIGLKSKLVDEGRKESKGGGGNEAWKALGDYCPFIQIEYIEENMEYIERHPTEELSRKKSAEILKLLLKLSNKLSGVRRYRKSAPYEKTEESYLLHISKSWYKWLYDKNEDLCSIKELSKYELNTSIYGAPIHDKEVYLSLGFIEKEIDAAAEAYDSIASLEVREQLILLKQLARKFNLHISEDDSDKDHEDELSESYFNPNEYLSDEFPARKVKDKDNLKKHVTQEFFCADPITYKKVWSQVRTSKDPQIVRAYIIGMYTNNSNIRICQMCKEPSDHLVATQIANYGIEMKQLNLCLCPNCASKYKKIRDNNKEDFKQIIKAKICFWSESIEDSYNEYDLDEYEIELENNIVLHFNQTHIIEIATVYKLLDEYGVPTEDVDEEEYLTSSNYTYSFRSNIEPLDEPAATIERELLTDKSDVVTYENDGIAIKNGNLITLQDVETGAIRKVTVNGYKYWTHKTLIGKNLDEEIYFSGKNYRISDIRTV